MASLGAIEEATGGINHGVTAPDRIDRFRDQTDSGEGDGLVALDKGIKSCAGNGQVVDVLVVLAGDGHDLQNLPAGDAA